MSANDCRAFIVSFCKYPISSGNYLSFYHCFFSKVSCPICDRHKAGVWLSRSRLKLQTRGVGGGGGGVEERDCPEKTGLCKHYILSKLSLG